MINVGAVPYINALPLIRGLPYPIRTENPAALERLLKLAELDLATAPITSLFEHPDWCAVPGLAIGTRTSAQSVAVFTREPGLTLETIESIYIDMESRTSALLLKVLLACKYGRDLKTIEWVHPLPQPDLQAKLLIGDKALRERMAPTGPGAIIDLGTEWTQWTGLPFVFACWVSRASRLEARLLATLTQAAQANLSHLEDWLPEIKGFPTELTRPYFTEHMYYGFGEAEVMGLMTFYQYLRELEIYEAPFRLNFVSP